MSHQFSDHKKVKTNIKLGPKGARPPKRHLNPRKKKEEGLPRLIGEFFDGNKNEVEHLLTTYENGTIAIKDGIIIMLSVHKRVPLRLIRSILNIGSHRLNRLRKGIAKKKPGGDKPNYVSKVQLIRLYENKTKVTILCVCS
jgi:hypothetical protein